jgi:hypothetical protein
VVVVVVAVVVTEFHATDAPNPEPTAPTLAPRRRVGYDAYPTRSRQGNAHLWPAIR